MILVSACLAGEACRYDGRPAEVAGLRELVETGQALAVCPELLGGLAAPRPPAEIRGGSAEAVLDGEARVFDAQGADVTEPFLAGAAAVLRLAGECRATQVILKDRSPSCGVSLIYDGTFQGRRVPGQGVTAALLRRNGFGVISDTDWMERGRT